MAKANSWCPRQIPKTGRGLGSDKTRLSEDITLGYEAGSPGPLLRKRPSYSGVGRKDDIKTSIQLETHLQPLLLDRSPDLHCLPYDSCCRDGSPTHAICLWLLTLAVQLMVPWYHSDLGPTLAQASDLIIFEATVQSEDPRGTPCIDYPWCLRNKGQQLVAVINRYRYAHTYPQF